MEGEAQFEYYRLPSTPIHPPAALLSTSRCPGFNQALEGDPVTSIHSNILTSAFGRYPRRVGAEVLGARCYRLEICMTSQNPTRSSQYQTIFCIFFSFSFSFFFFLIKPQLKKNLSFPLKISQTEKRNIPQLGVTIGSILVIIFFCLEGFL
jgi:hypothetical protein